jgi:hypothetical protein
MVARRAMRSALGCLAIPMAVAWFALTSDRAVAAEPVEIFDAHLHYNWEPKPYYRLHEVLALFKKHRVTGILATSRPNTDQLPRLARSTIAGNCARQCTGAVRRQPLSVQSAN